MMRSILLALLGSSALLAQIPHLDRVIEESIQKNEIPGAVCLVGYKGRVLHYKAYGQRAVEPKGEAMTLDTIFDAASLTKVVATTSSIMRLVEDGKLRLNDRVTVYLPEFQGGKSEITVRNLLTHYSGLRPDLDLEPAWEGYELGIQKALVDKPTSEPGVKFVYSDINFILLGEIVRRLGGKPLPDFARENVFAPLGMADTMFQPPAALRARIAPTEKLKGEATSLRGVVHDETTRYMGGIAGHAGLFTTAEDLSRFARMMLAKGQGLFAPATIARFTSVNSPAGQSALRGLGWDIDSPFAGNRGDLYPIGSFGHTGFTGTSLWIDPASDSYVILLTNGVHPFRRPPVTPLRGRVASVAAAYVSRLEAQSSPRASGAVLTGLDRLREEKFAALQNKNVGLITNHTGIARDGMRNIDLMLAAGVPLKALFSPEHGFLGKLDVEKVGDSKDEATKLPVYSLYADESRKPNLIHLKGINTIVFDIQDIGARFYTYGCTLKNSMEVAAQLNIEFVVLDRPNPITGQHVEGPVIEAAEQSFVGCLPLPVRHGLSMGELARFANDTLPKRARLSVVPMKNWQRDQWFDSTALPWVNPSPNIRSLNAAILYPAVALLEYSKNYSVGRGTDAPFEQIGAPWIRGVDLAEELNSRKIPGVRVYPTSFEPNASIHSGKRCEGVRFVLTNRDAFDSAAFGLTIIQSLRRLYPKEIQLEVNRKLIGNMDTIRRLERGEEPSQVLAAASEALRQFQEKRLKVLIYD
jgi:uncharacterized protein YbbC (DUF1343 family)